MPSVRQAPHIAGRVCWFDERGGNALLQIADRSSFAGVRKGLLCSPLSFRNLHSRQVIFTHTHTHTRTASVIRRQAHCQRNAAMDGASTDEDQNSPRALLGVCSIAFAATMLPFALVLATNHRRVQPATTLAPLVAALTLHTNPVRHPRRPQRPTPGRQNLIITPSRPSPRRTPACPRTSIA